MTPVQYSFRDLGGICDMTAAFQPIVNVDSGMPLVYQAIVTAGAGRSFEATLGTATPEARDSLDRLRSERAIAQAVAAGLLDTQALLALPVRAAGNRPEAMLPQILKTALIHGLPLERLVIEVSADERGDFAAALALADACAARGVAIAFDHFSAGPLGLRLLARHTPVFVRLDPELTRGIDASASRRLMVESVQRLVRSMQAALVAPRVETAAEITALYAIGIRHMQGDRIAPATRDRLPQPAPAAAPQPRHEVRGNLAAYARRDLSSMHRRLLHHSRRAPAPCAAPQPMAAAAV